MFALKLLECGGLTPLWLYNALALQLAADRQNVYKREAEC
jgi:hypothetical protein